MRTAVADNMQDSAEATSRYVWPLLLKELGGVVEPVEREATQMAQQLDMVAGIDYWHVSRGAGMVGVGTRVQWIDTESGPNAVVPKGWRSFTVRVERANGTKSEYDRILQVANQPGVKPHLMVHAYFKKPKRSGDLVAVAVARSRDVVHLLQLQRARDGDCKAAGMRVNPDDGTKFGVVTWEALERARMPLLVVRPIMDGVMTEVSGARNGGVERLWTNEYEW